MDQEIKTLIDGLNEDLAHEYAAVISYTHHAAVVSGLARPILKELFEKEAQDELTHASYLSEKIADLVQPGEIKQAEEVRGYWKAPSPMKKRQSVCKKVQTATDGCGFFRVSVPICINECGQQLCSSVSMNCYNTKNADITVVLGGYKGLLTFI